MYPCSLTFFLEEKRWKKIKWTFLKMKIEFGSGRFRYFKLVLRICIGFKADPDPSFYINADLDLDPGWLFMRQKVNFILWKIYLKIKIVRGQKTHLRYEGTKDFLKGMKQGLFVKNVGQFPCFWIRIRIPIRTRIIEDPWIIQSWWTWKIAYWWPFKGVRDKFVFKASCSEWNR